MEVGNDILIGSRQTLHRAVASLPHLSAHKVLTVPYLETFQRLGSEVQVASPPKHDNLVIF